MDVRFAVVGVSVRISLRHPGCRTDRPGFRFLSGTLRVLGREVDYRDRKNTHDRQARHSHNCSGFHSSPLIESPKPFRLVFGAPWEFEF